MLAWYPEDIWRYVLGEAPHRFSDRQKGHT
jgi:hypothetical protein